MDLLGLLEPFVAFTINAIIADKATTAAVPFAMLETSRNCNANTEAASIPIQIPIPVMVDIIRLSSLSPANLVAAINPTTNPEKATIVTNPFAIALSSNPLIIFTDIAIDNNAAPIPSIALPIPEASLL